MQVIQMRYEHGLYPFDEIAATCSEAHQGFAELLPGTHGLLYRRWRSGEPVSPVKYGGS